MTHRARYERRTESHRPDQRRRREEEEIIKEKEEQAAREAFSAPSRGLVPNSRPETRLRNRGEAAGHRKLLEPSRDSQAKNFWNRLDHVSGGNKASEYERHHPYRRPSRDVAINSLRGSESFNNKNRYGDSDSSSNWRIKGYSPNQDRYREHIVEKKPGHASNSNRSSPDSQRTISESNRYLRNAYQARGNDHHERNGSRYQARYEPHLDWKPVRTIEKRNKDVRATSNEDNESRETERETEDERRRRIKGKAVAVDKSGEAAVLEPPRGANGMVRIIETTLNTIPENQELLGNNQNTIIPPRESLTLNKNKEISPLNTVRERIAGTSLTEVERIQTGVSRKEGTGEDIQLLTDEEMNQIAEKYPSLNFEMDEEMLDDDDLLDEIPEEEEGVPETQEVEAQKKESSKVRVIGEGRNTADKGSRALTGLHQGTEKKAKLPNENVFDFEMEDTSCILIGWEEKDHMSFEIR
ncbi:hypothetical protein Bca101_082171 [Brassica carinata]